MTRADLKQALRSANDIIEADDILITHTYYVTPREKYIFLDGLFGLKGIVSDYSEIFIEDYKRALCVVINQT